MLAYKICCHGEILQNIRCMEIAFEDCNLAAIGEIQWNIHLVLFERSLRLSRLYKKDYKKLFRLITKRNIVQYFHGELVDYEVFYLVLKNKQSLSLSIV